MPDDCDDCVLNAMQKLAQAVRRELGKARDRRDRVGRQDDDQGVRGYCGGARRKISSVLKTEGNFNNHFGRAVDAAAAGARA